MHSGPVGEEYKEIPREQQAWGAEMLCNALSFPISPGKGEWRTKGAAAPPLLFSAGKHKAPRRAEGSLVKQGHPTHMYTNPHTLCVFVQQSFLIFWLAWQIAAAPYAELCEPRWHRFPFPYSISFHFLLSVVSPRSQVKCCRWPGWGRGVGHAGRVRATIWATWPWARLVGAAAVESCTRFAFHLLCCNGLGSPRLS